MLNVYADFCEQVLAIPVVKGQKTEKEKFAGAVATYTIEALMHDGKALQSGTSHFMGQNFARAFDITFNDVNNEQSYAHTTSWGLSTRMIGAIIMAHGDDRGLVLPPRLAPHQLVIVPITRSKDPAANEGVLARARSLASELQAAGVRVKVDEREGMSPGWKFNEWEQKGVPLRLEIGPRDLENGVALLADRLGGDKEELALDSIAAAIPARLEQFQQALYDRALKFREDHTSHAETMEELKEKVEHGFVYATHCGDPESEKQIQEETKATIRCIPLEGPSAEGTVCIHTGKPSGYARKVIFAKAY